MWWDHQNLDKPRRDSDGVRWNVRVWHDVVKNKHVARVFFWNDERDVCGVRIFGPDERTHVTALHAFIEKLISSSDLRQKYSRDLHFPLERHYSAYGVFPEES
jgi:hypothetical protein